LHILRNNEGGFEANYFDPFGSGGIELIQTDLLGFGSAKETHADASKQYHQAQFLQNNVGRLINEVFSQGVMTLISQSQTIIQPKENYEATNSHCGAFVADFLIKSVKGEVRINQDGKLEEMQQETREFTQVISKDKSNSDDFGKSLREGQIKLLKANIREQQAGNSRKRKREGGEDNESDADEPSSKKSTAARSTAGKSTSSATPSASILDASVSSSADSSRSRGG
jgi:hypothetical protein